MGSRLRGGSLRALLDERLQSVQIVVGALRERGCGEDRAAILLQDFQPALDISGVIAAGLGGQLQIGAEESRAKLSDQLFTGVAFIAPALAAKVAIKAALMLRPVGQLMSKRCIVVFRAGNVSKAGICT